MYAEKVEEVAAEMERERAGARLGGRPPRRPASWSRRAAEAPPPPNPGQQARWVRYVGPE